MKVPKEESKEQHNDNTLNDDDNLSNPYDTESNSDSIDPPTRDGDFSEYMWMENQEEFDLQVYIHQFIYRFLFSSWISHHLPVVSMVKWLSFCLKMIIPIWNFNIQ